MDRRDFVKLCATSAALSGAHCSALAAVEGNARMYAPARLVDKEGRPIKAAQLHPDRNYLFHYPYVGTPCFLLNLGRPPVKQVVELMTDAGQGYHWEGGVGPRRSIVSYSAICAHQLAYPTRQLSFISYKGADAGRTESRATPNTIHCCAEHSEYDPAKGAKVVAGPAKQPLATILLDYDPKADEILAVGTLGGELFEAFFAKYEFKLTMEHGQEKARQSVGNTAVVTELTQFCRQEIHC
jgi:Rieske Fe-S protein